MINTCFSEPVTREQRAREMSFTPSEAAAPHPLMHRAITDRLEVLLLKHEPELFPSWAKSMEEKGNGRTVTPYWGQMLAYIAAVLPLVKEEHETVTTGDSQRLLSEWRTDRNRNLLVRLVLKGCRRRDEF